MLYHPLFSMLIIFSNSSTQKGHAHTHTHHLIFPELVAIPQPSPHTIATHPPSKQQGRIERSTRGQRHRRYHG